MFAPIPSPPLEIVNDETNKVFDNKSHIIVRRLHSDETPTPITPILILDSAANISCAGREFEILFFMGMKSTIGGGGIPEMGSITYVIVSTATIAENPITMQQYIIIINQAAYVPGENQFESLLHTDQARYHNVIINNLRKFFKDSNGNMGKQSIEVDGFEVPVMHGGSKYFLTIRKPTKADWNELPIIELTSPLPWGKTENNERLLKVEELFTPH